VVEEEIDECDQYDSALAQLDPAVKADAYARVISEVGDQYNATWSGLSGRSWKEKMGWTAGQQLGDRILGDNITIVDDPEHPDTFKMAFDITGKRRGRFPLVEEGRLSQLMYDASTAAKYSRPATGHSTGSVSLTVSPGDGPPDPLAAVADLGRMLYIPDLHYMHLPNRSQGIFTGSSRFNAVLVEHGWIACPIFSTHVTDSFRNFLEHATVISSETRSVNTSNTYGRRQPTAMSVPTYMLVEGVKVTDCADSY